VKRGLTVLCVVLFVAPVALVALSFCKRIAVSLLQDKTCLNNTKWREEKSFEVHAVRG